MNPDYRHFEEVIREYERETTERLVGARESVAVHQAQGAITACRVLREFVDSAPDTLRKMTGK